MSAGDQDALWEQRLQVVYQELRSMRSWSVRLYRCGFSSVQREAVIFRRVYRLELRTECRGEGCACSVWYEVPDVR